MGKYVDSFIVAVPKKNLDEYKRIANISADLWMDHGAIDYVECIADDVSVGELTSFPRSVNLEEGEVVIVAYITYENKSHRDEVNKKVFEDPRMGEAIDIKNLPFDGKRMIIGGFETFLERTKGN